MPSGVSKTWFTPKRLEALGYVRYPIAPGPDYKFVENLDVIRELIGTICYETFLSGEGPYWIRRSE